jgi:hypothetical protein
MKDEVSKNIQTKLTALAYYQIIGGVIGLGLLFWLIFNLTTFSSLLLLVLVPGFFLFLFSILSGILLIKKKNTALQLSLINQYLQLFSFSYLGYAYMYSSGFYFSIGLDITNSMTFLFNFGVSSWTLNINTDTPTIAVNLNLIALYLIIVLMKLKKQLQFEEVKKEIENLPSP